MPKPGNLTPKSKVSSEFVTLSDVANLAGVGVSTASAVLRGAASQVRIAATTQQRVETAARELSYRPNAIARSLRTRRTDIIGLYGGFGDYVDVRSSFNAEIISGMQDQCGLLGNDLLLHSSVKSGAAQDVYDQLANGRICSLVLNSPPGDQLVKLLVASSLPAVVVANAVADLPSVIIDDEAASLLLAEHLANKGYRRILYRKGLNFENTISLCRRMAAFRRYAQEHGMDIIETLEEETGWSLSEQETALLNQGTQTRPDAAVCWHDQSAYGFIRSCERLGLRVPEDLAVVGFNGISTDASRLCQLTTIKAPWREVGQQAIQVLVELMHGREVRQETVLPVALSIGTTT